METRLKGVREQDRRILEHEIDLANEYKEVILGISACIKYLSWDILFKKRIDKSHSRRSSPASQYSVLTPSWLGPCHQLPRWKIVSLDIRP